VPDTYDGPDAAPPEHGEVAEEAERKIGSVGRLGTGTGGSSSPDQDEMAETGVSDQA
jgi:hypothetical protein